MSEFRGLSQDDILSRVEGGESIAKVAESLDCDRSTLWRWIEADPQRSARAREARIVAASAWDEKAEMAIEAADSPLGLAKARELAQHYRWRASKIAPKIYGDKLDVAHSGGVTVTWPVAPPKLEA